MSLERNNYFCRGGEKMKLSPEDQKDIDKVLQKTQSVEQNVVEEHSMTTEMRPVSLQGFKGVDIVGMEEVPAGLGIPYVRLVQPTTQQTDTHDGKEAQVGTFLFSDTKEAVDKLEFVLLAAKIVPVAFMREGDNGVMAEVKTTKLRLLGMTIAQDKLFTLSLSPTSFGAFGGVISQFKILSVKKSWQFVLSATSRKRENKKGKFYVIDFAIGTEVTGENLIACEQKAIEYTGALDQAIIDEE